MVNGREFCGHLLLVELVVTVCFYLNESMAVISSQHDCPVIPALINIAPSRGNYQSHTHHVVKTTGIPVKMYVSYLQKLFSRPKCHTLSLKNIIPFKTLVQYTVVFSYNASMMLKPSTSIWTSPNATARQPNSLAARGCRSRLALGY